MLRSGLSVAAAGAAALDLAKPRHVRALYLDTLGRTPDGDELELAPAAGPARLVALLTGGLPFWRHWYEDELQFFLLLDNFRPAEEPPGESLPERLAARQLGLGDAVRSLLSGSAFHRANPGNDTFVSVVFEQLLGLEVQQNRIQLEAGKRMYDGKSASLWGTRGHSQADVVAIACAQPAFWGQLVARQYRRVVGLAPSSSRGDPISAWARQLAEEPHAFPELVAEWLLSPAYAERLVSLRRKTDRQFLRGLMVDLTGEVGAPELLARARRALAAVADGGPLRSVIARVLLERFGAGLPDLPPGELVDRVYRRFLGRSPGPEERDAVLLAYEQGAGDPDLLVRAVITHWEYQYY